MCESTYILSITRYAPFLSGRLLTGQRRLKRLPCGSPTTRSGLPHTRVCRLLCVHLSPRLVRLARVCLLVSPCVRSVVARLTTLSRAAGARTESSHTSSSSSLASHQPQAKRHADAMSAASSSIAGDDATVIGMKTKAANPLLGTGRHTPATRRLPAEAPGGDRTDRLASRCAPGLVVVDQ